jgi:hypothetical protein
LEDSLAPNLTTYWRVILVALIYGAIMLRHGADSLAAYLGALVVAFLADAVAEKRNRTQTLLLVALRQLEKERANAANRAV